MCGLLLSLAACGNYTIPDDTSPPLQVDQQNPFKVAEDVAGFLAVLSHQAAKPDFSERRERMPFEYDGGEFQLPTNWIPSDFSCSWMTGCSHINRMAQLHRSLKQAIGFLLFFWEHIRTAEVSIL